jgi:type IV secretory pathway TrbD component
MADKEKAGREHSARVERIYAALWRPRLWLDCERIPLVIGGGSALFCVPIAFHTNNLWWMLAGIVYLAAVIGFLKKLAEYDPHFFAVFFRYINLDLPFVRDWLPRYDRHFPARSSVYASRPDARRHQR